MSRVSPFRIATATGLAVGAAVVGVALPSVALAEEALPALSLSTSNVAAGTAFTVSGTECIQMGKDPVGTVLAYAGTDVQGMEEAAVEVAEDGTWTASLTFPAGTAAGTYAVYGACDTYWEVTDYPVASVTVGSAAPAAAPAKAQVSVANGVTTVTAAPGQSLTPEKAFTPGQKLRLNLTGYTPGELTAWTLHSTPRDLGDHTADGTGTLSAALTLPTDVEAGEHELWVTRADGTVLKYPVTIAAAGPQLAYTGADVTVPLVLGGVLVLAGAGALVATRRHRGTGAAV
ncbi:LPXTG cell wall anchor domain-containing protein [Modestobacter sp. SYSU DS0290]